MSATKNKEALAKALDLITRLRNALADYPGLHTDALRKASAAFLADPSADLHPVLALLDVAEEQHAQFAAIEEQSASLKANCETLAKRIRRML